MNTRISYKNIFKASFAAVFLLAVFFASLIWLFGGKANLETEIARAPHFSNFEEFKKVSSPAKANLTSDISEIIAKELVEKNPLGPVPNQAGITQIDAINPDELIETSIQEGLSAFNPDEFRYQADFSRLKTTSVNLKERQAQYFSEINESINKAFENSETINYINPAQSNFPAIVARYEKAIEALYQTETPSDLLRYHVNLISLLGTHKNIYAVISNIEEDPLQAYLIAQFGLQVENELVFLSNEMNQYIEENSIIET